MAEFSIIGIGASAGGIDAFHSFFDHMPADCGMAFVMVLHLPPDRKSMLTEILARWTSMPVIDVTGRVAIEPNHVSGWGQESDRRQAYLAGFDHHLTKPIDPDQLEDLFEKAAG